MRLRTPEAARAPAVRAAGHNGGGDENADGASELGSHGSYHPFNTRSSVWNSGRPERALGLHLLRGGIGLGQGLLKGFLIQLLHSRVPPASSSVVVWPGRAGRRGPGPWCRTVAPARPRRTPRNSAGGAGPGIPAPAPPGRRTGRPPPAPNRYTYRAVSSSSRRFFQGEASRSRQRFTVTFASQGRSFPGAGGFSSRVRNTSWQMSSASWGERV